MIDKKEAHLHAEVKIENSVEAWLRSYFSLRYIKSSIYLANQACMIEEKNAENPPENIIDQHSAYVIASIFTAISFLEASINEILRDSNDAAKGTYREAETYIPADIIPKLAQFTDIFKKNRNIPILQKYQIALEFSQKERFNEQEKLYLDILNFKALRNKLVHYIPSWSKIEPPEEYVPGDELQKYLYGMFELNPLTGKGNPFLFDKCLGYGCCKWGIESSIAFTDEFCSRTGIISKYANIRKKLVLL